MKDIKQCIFQEIDKSWDEQISFLQSLVQCQSTLFNESLVQQIVSRKMRALGLEVDIFDVDISDISKHKGYSPVEWGYYGRPQVVGVWRAPKYDDKGKSLVLNGHLDVVDPGPAELWDYDPWGGEIIGDRMYGRGTEDMKSGFSAILYAISALRKLGINLGADLIVQSVIEEEASGNGTLGCLTRGYIGDAALLVESTNQRILLAQPGTLWLRTLVRGLPAHVGGSNCGANAIELSYIVIKALKELEKEWNCNNPPLAFREISHPINFNIGMIKGGSWPSMVPAECEFTTRLAFYPGITPEEAKNKVLKHLNDALSYEEWLSKNPPKLSWYGHHGEGVILDPQEPFLQKLAQTHKEVTNREVGYFKATAGSDARFWPLYYNRPATCYGPSGGNSHGNNEYVNLPSVLETTKVIASFIVDWCGIL